MTKADLADLIHEKLSCQKKEAVELLDLTLGILKEAIATEGHVKISGFGNFVGAEEGRPYRKEPADRGNHHHFVTESSYVQAERNIEESNQSKAIDTGRSAFTTHHYS